MVFTSFRPNGIDEAGAAAHKRHLTFDEVAGDGPPVLCAEIRKTPADDRRGGCRADSPDTV